MKKRKKKNEVVLMLAGVLLKRGGPPKVGRMKVVPSYLGPRVESPLSPFVLEAFGACASA